MDRAREGEVERGSSVIGQAPLGGFKAPPSPLVFRLVSVIPGRNELVKFIRCLRLGIVGYLIPVCVLAFVGSGRIKPLS